MGLWRGPLPAAVAIPLAVGSVLLVLLTLPVSMPLIALFGAIDARRLRAAACRTPCGGCGQVLGTAALSAADAAWTVELAERHRRLPGLRLRVVRRCHALCTVCGARYGWTDRRLQRLPDKGAA